MATLDSAPPERQTDSHTAALLHLAGKISALIVAVDRLTHELEAHEAAAQRRHDEAATRVRVRGFEG